VKAAAKDESGYIFGLAWITVKNIIEQRTNHITPTGATLVGVFFGATLLQQDKHAAFFNCIECYQKPIRIGAAGFHLRSCV